jgi:hypothetical protein
MTRRWKYKGAGLCTEDDIYIMQGGQEYKQMSVHLFIANETAHHVIEAIASEIING